MTAFDQAPFDPHVVAIAADLMLAWSDDRVRHWERATASLPPERQERIAVEVVILAQSLVAERGRAAEPAVRGLARIVATALHDPQSARSALETMTERRSLDTVLGGRSAAKPAVHAGKPRFPGALALRLAANVARDGRASTTTDENVALAPILGIRG